LSRMLQGKRPLGRATLMLEKWHEGLDLIQLVQERDHQLASVNTVMDLRVS
jgi:hypothetical protein